MSSTELFNLRDSRLFKEGGTEGRSLKEIVELLSKTYPESGVTFTGVVDLTRTLTIYDSYTVSSDIEITAGSNPLIGGGAELTLVGDGSHTPTFNVALTATPNSGSFDNTLNTVNKVGFYYDGSIYWYTITVIS